jgi:hypothetical protein
MSNLKHTQADFLQAAGTLIENAAAIPAVAAALAGYGYDSSRLEEGRALWAEADALAKRQALDSGERGVATQDQDAAWAQANAAYIKSLKVARVAFGEDPKAIAALKLYGPRKQSLPGWLEQAGTFYANLAADQPLAKCLARFGYTQAKLAAEAALVEALRSKTRAKAEGVGTAQASTAARDRKLRELDAWVSELRTIARVAFYESPQELEKLGVLALNGPRRQGNKGGPAAGAPATAGAKA